MKKVNALVIGIVFLFAALSPSTSAFADSDPGIAGQVFNSAFSWYTGFPLVDSNGYLDLNDWTITYRSNGVDSTSTAGSGDVVYLYQSGDYIEYSFQQYDLLSSYVTPVWFLQFGQNPAYSSGGLSDLKYTLFQSYTSSESSYKFIRPFSYDNRMIDWTHVMFSYPGSGITKIRIEYDGTPAIWNCIYMKFLGFRVSTDAITQADLYQIQAQITTALNVARLADLIELDASNIDLSTLEATTSSILLKLNNVPDIIQYIDQIETTDSNILSAINTFYNYYISLFENYTFKHNSNHNYSLYYYSNGNWSSKNSSNDYFYVIHPDEYIFISQYYYQLLSYNDFLVYKIRFPSNNTCRSFNCYYHYASSPSNFIGYSAYSYYSNYTLYIYVPYIDTSISTWLSFTIQPTSNAMFQFYISNYDYYSSPYNLSWYKRIELFLRQLLGDSSIVPAGIQQTTDTVTEQVTDIVEFEDTYNQSLESSATQIDVSSYEIQQTQGMSFMRTYTELNFDRMQNFRILFLTPLILALAAFFLRRKT